DHACVMPQQLTLLAGATPRPPPLLLNGSNTQLCTTARCRPGPPHQPRHRSLPSRPWAMRSSFFPPQPLPPRLLLTFLPLRLRPSHAQTSCSTSGSPRTATRPRPAISLPPSGRSGPLHRASVLRPLASARRLPASPASASLLSGSFPTRSAAAIKTPDGSSL